jgi:hypothetical protein
MTTITNITTTYLVAAEALKQAKEAEAQAREALKEAFAKAGVDSFVVGDTKVSVNEKTRVTYDADALAANVSAALFRSLTKAAVDSAALKAAVTLGKISDEVLAKVANESTYEEVRVRNLA